MKAIKILTKLVNDQVQTPSAFETVLKTSSDEDICDIDLSDNEETSFKLLAKEEFLKGYSASDSIYDQMPLN